MIEQLNQPETLEKESIDPRQKNESDDENFDNSDDYSVPS